MLRVGDQSLAGRIPEGLRDAVGKRLSRLSDSTNRVLSVDSVIGHEFQLDVLRQVVTNTDEELEAALEEASAAVMIEEQSVVGTNIAYRPERHAAIVAAYDFSSVRLLVDIGGATGSSSRSPQRLR